MPITNLASPLISLNMSKSLLAISCYWLSTGLAANETINLRQAVESGLDNSYSVRVIDERIRSQEFTIAYDESQLKTRVNLSASGSFRHNRNYNAGSDSVDSSNVWPLSGSLNVNYPLFTTAILQQLSLDASELARIKLEREQQRLEVIGQVMDYYLTILELHDNIDLQQSQLQSLRSRERDTQLRLDNGVGNRLDLIEIEADLAVQEATLLELQASLSANYLALEQITGAAIERIYPLKTDIDLPTPASLEPGYWRNASRNANIDLLILRQSLNSQRESVRLVEKGYLPSLSAFASFDPGMNYQDSEFQESTSASVGLSFSYSLHDSGQRQADISRALAQVRELEESIKAQQQAIDIQIDLLTPKLGAQSDVIAARARSQSAAQEKLRSTQISYENGISNINDLLDAENELQQAGNAYNQSLYNYLRDYFDLLNISGRVNLRRLEVFYQLLDS